MVVYKDSLVLFGGWSHPTPYPLHQVGYNEFEKNQEIQKAYFVVCKLFIKLQIAVQT